jgi:DNA-binding response OmpR family regulator
MKLVPSILIIEDDTWFAEQGIRTLEAAGFRVRHAADGLAGIEAIDSVVPDVIILDMFLPGPNALVLLHELQSHTDLSCIPVIICTNSASSVPTASLKAYGVRQVLDKGSMQPHDLVTAIRRVLS